MAILLVIISVSLFITVSSAQALSIDMPIGIPIDIIPTIDLETASPTASFNPISTPTPMEITIPKPAEEVFQIQGQIPKPAEKVIRGQVQIQKRERDQQMVIPRARLQELGLEREPNPARILEQLRFHSQFERTRDLDKKVEVGGRRIKIATEGGRTKLIDRGVTALVEGDIKWLINILPGDAKKKVPGAQKVSLIDKDNPKYLITREIKGKIFGIVSIQSLLTHQVNAQTGVIIKQDKPWWWKNFVKETGIVLDEGEACSLSSPDWCRSGLSCQSKGSGTLVPSDVGECRLSPPTVHGKIFVVTPDGQTISLHKRVKNLPDVEVLDIKTYFSSHPQCGESQVTEIFFDDQGNFLMDSLVQGVYSIYSLITFGSDPNHSVPHSWGFSVNDGPEVNSINLSGANYNENNQIRVLKSSSSLPFPPPPCPLQP